MERRSFRHRGQGRIRRRFAKPSRNPMGARAVLPFAVLLSLLLMVAADGFAVTIPEIQFTTDPGGASPYAGQVVTTRGVVTANYPYGYVMEESTGGPWSGLWVYDSDHRPELGDELELTGLVNEYFGLTELMDLTGYELLAQGVPLPGPDTVVAGSLATGAPTAEAYEGVYVCCRDLEVIDPAAGDGSWRVGDPTGSTLVGDRADYLYTPVLGDTLSLVKGVQFYSWSEFRLEPRSEDDLGRLDIVPFALRGTVVTPDTVLTDAYVTVSGRRIVSVTTAPPGTLTVYETEGVIFPGLIDAHNHPAYSVFDRLDFGEFFENRYQWQSHPLYQELKTVYQELSGLGLYPEMWKYGEIRGLLWGAGSIQGAFSTSGWDAYAHAKILLRNPERLPGRVYTSVFPMSLTAYERDRLRMRIDSGVYRSVVIHLSEGTDSSSLDEFYQWQTWGLLDSTTAIIHGIPYGATEFALMESAGASLIWSPRSNLYLYGQTANIPLAMSAGVLVSIAPDWCASGSQGMLQELFLADSLDQDAYGGIISDSELVKMVTVNPARTLGREDELGRIEPGYLADLTIVAPTTGGSAYRALIEADPRDVLLVMVEGRALYGVTSLMSALHPDETDLEPVEICGDDDRRALIRIDDPAIPLCDESLADIVGLLASAYPDILPLDPCGGVPATVSQDEGPAPAGAGSADRDASTLELTAEPVPFGRELIIRFSAARSRDEWSAAPEARVVVFDVTGRVIRSLFEGSPAATEISLRWDGRDDSGRAVSPGVYFVRATQGQDRITRRVVLVQ